MKDTSDQAKLQDYLRKYPNGAYASLAIAKIDGLTKLAAANENVEKEFWDTVKKSDNAEFIREYIRRYPNGIYVGLAKIRIAQIEPKVKPADPEEERRLWNSVKSSGDVDRLNTYLVRYPTGLYADVARETIRLIAARQAAELAAQASQNSAQSSQNNSSGGDISSSSSESSVYGDDCGNSSLSGLSAREQARTQVMLYYRDLNNRNVNCALSRWANPSCKLPRLIRQFGGAAANNVRVSSYRGNRMTVRANVKVRKRGGRWEHYRMRIYMIRRSGQWLISKLRTR